MARLSNPSPFQQAIFDWAKTGQGSAVLCAVAGSGKTTTIVELAYLIESFKTSTFVAFNKVIADELATRLPSHVRSCTLNAMGFRAWLAHTGAKMGQIQLRPNKSVEIMRSLFPDSVIAQFIGVVPKLVALAKSVGIVPGNKADFQWLTPDTDEEWLGLIEHYALDVEEPKQAQAIDLSRQVLQESIRCGKTLMDFDDQLYLPVVHGASFTQNDWLMVDEAQDVNKIQREMLKRSLKTGGRLVAVGDPAQAIYGFRGADTKSIENIKKEFNATELPLTISYRCPKAVVEEARKYVGHITCAETADEGKVGTLPKYNGRDFGPTDLVICRNTAPLVSLVFKLLRNRIAARILGREIGASVIALINQMKAKSIEELEDRINEYRNREVSRLVQKGKEQQAENLNDKVDTVLAFTVNLPEAERNIPDLIKSIESVFNDNGKGILTLCTVHKAKGLEAPTVFILDPQLMPSTYATQPWQLEQERNLQYVAVTRAQKVLWYITSAGYEDRAKPATVTPAPPLREQPETDPTAPLMCGKDYSGATFAEQLQADTHKRLVDSKSVLVALQNEEPTIASQLHPLTTKEFVTALGDLTGGDKYNYSREWATRLKLKADYSPQEAINHMQRCMAIKKYLKERGL